MVSDPTTARSGRPRWLTIVAVVSLAINLMIAGAVAGHLLSGRHHVWRESEVMRGETRMPDRPGEAVIQRMTAAVPPENRAVFLAVIAEHRQQIADAGRQVRDARIKVRDAIAADPFDRAKLDQAFAALRERSQQLQASLHATVSDAASKLPPDARAQLADFNRLRRGR